MIFSQPKHQEMVNYWSKIKQTGLRCSYTIYPGICCNCNKKTGKCRDLCDKCYENLEKPKNRCCHCGLRQQLNGRLCQQCQQQPMFDWNELLCPLDYTGLASDLIRAFKYQYQLANSRILASFLGEKLKTHYSYSQANPQSNPQSTPRPQDYWPEAIIPVPLHWTRQFSRGFNQSLLLARDLQLELPIDTRYLLRSSRTAPQESLSLQQRAQNLQDVFRLHPRAKPYRHVALLDDVVTTGATLGSICRLLQNHGVEKIDCWAIARTPKQSERLSSQKNLLG